MTARRDYMRRYRSLHGGTSPVDKAQNRASAAAVAWVRKNRPELWRELLDDAREHYGLPRKGGG